MFITRQKNVTLTLFICIVLILTISAPSEAKDFQHIQHRDHVNLKRLIKKRSPFPQGDRPTPLIPVVGAGAAVPTTFSTTTESSTTPLTEASPTNTSSTVSATESSSTSTSASDSETSSATSASVSESTTSTSQTSTSTSTTAPTTPPAPSETLNVSMAAPDNIQAKPTITKTESVDATDTGTPVPLPQSNSSKTKSTALTALIVVAASVAGVAILWTIFRKWKLGRSSKFDERLQPIDWQPTNPDDGIIPVHRRASSGASSFHSGTGHGNIAGRGGGGYGLDHNNSDHGHGLSLPDHDFTAVPSTLAPVGGYADLARGPSPQPQMHQMSRGPSLTRPAYDVGVPLHHQTGYAIHDAYDYQGGSRRY